MNSITITKDQFIEAVKTANENFANLGNKNDQHEEGVAMANLVMGLQNIMFGSMIADVLFSENKGE